MPKEPIDPRSYLPLTPLAFQVLLALARVDEVYQAAVALFYLEDYSYKDIAEILEVPVGTIKSRIARGIEQLRRILLPEDCTRECSDPGRDLSATPLLEPVDDF